MPWDPCQSPYIPPGRQCGRHCLRPGAARQLLHPKSCCSRGDRHPQELQLIVHGAVGGDDACFVSHMPGGLEAVAPLSEGLLWGHPDPSDAACPHSRICSCSCWLGWWRCFAADPGGQAADGLQTGANHGMGRAFGLPQSTDTLQPATSHKFKLKSSAGFSFHLLAWCSRPPPPPGKGPR